MNAFQKLNNFSQLSLPSRLQMYLSNLEFQLDCTYQTLHVSSAAPTKHCMSARLNLSIMATASVTPQSLNGFSCDVPVLCKKCLLGIVQVCVPAWLHSNYFSSSAAQMCNKTNACTCEWLRAFWPMKAVSKWLDTLLVIDLPAQHAVLWKCRCVNRGHGRSQLTF